jgi:hypothetical protein
MKTKKSYCKYGYGLLILIILSVSTYAVIQIAFLKFGIQTQWNMHAVPQNEASSSRFVFTFTNGKTITVNDPLNQVTYVCNCFDEIQQRPSVRTYYFQKSSRILTTHPSEVIWVTPDEIRNGMGMGRSHTPRNNEVLTIAEDGRLK